MARASSPAGFKSAYGRALARKVIGDRYFSR
jgi:hypothetical protein